MSARTGPHSTRDSQNSRIYTHFEPNVANALKDSSEIYDLSHIVADCYLFI